MKNITELSTKEHCISCGIRGYFCESSMGRCGPSCPCCGQRHFLDWGESTKYRCRYDAGDKSDMRNRFLYCKDCGILFILGCIHFSRNHSNSEDVLHNAHLIQKWKDRETEVEYEGMPHFETPDDWFENSNLVEVLNIWCPHKGAVCLRKPKNQIQEYCNL